MKRPKAKRRQGHNRPQGADIFVDSDQVGFCANLNLDFHHTESGAENVTTKLGDTAPTDPDDMRSTNLKRKICENVSGNGLADADMQCDTPAVEDGRDASVDMRVLEETGMFKKRHGNQDSAEPSAKKTVFMIPRTMAQREGAIECICVDLNFSCNQKFAEWDLKNAVKVHLVDTPYGAQEFAADSSWRDLMKG